MLDVYVDAHMSGGYVGVVIYSYWLIGCMGCMGVLVSECYIYLYIYIGSINIFSCFIYTRMGMHNQGRCVILN